MTKLKCWVGVNVVVNPILIAGVRVFSDCRVV